MMVTKPWKIDPEVAKTFISRLPHLDEIVDIRIPGSEGSKPYPAGVALGVMAIHARTGQEFEAFVRDAQWIKFDGEHFMCGPDELQLLSGVAQLFDEAAARGWMVPQDEASEPADNQETNPAEGEETKSPAVVM